MVEGKSILVIDDDVELCELLRDYLTPEGFHVSSSHDGLSGLDNARRDIYDIIILDVMLPGMNGFDVLRHIRETSTVPVIMLTARGEDVDRIVGLEIGADDYLPKPFNPRELVARIRAIHRRIGITHQTQAAAQSIALGDVSLDPRARNVQQAGRDIEVTSAEFDLLAILLRSAGEVVSREELYERVLGRRFSAYDRSIDVHVSNLRKKLGDRPDGGERIKTIRGSGYLYVVR